MEAREAIVVLVVDSSIGMGEVEGDGTMLGNNNEEEGGGETAGEGGWAGTSSEAWGAGGGETWGGNWSAGSCCRADCAVLEPGGDLRAL